ncbi:unnamed protein product, partial [Mesorhabditis belari]|uniref:Uncharacterized protein n=1 Tax=Mesorhabditis belari TaxID=2138241 RepID=A0AAF3EV36_9BILA
MAPHFIISPLWICGSFELLQIEQGINTNNFRALMEYLIPIACVGFPWVYFAVVLVIQPNFILQKLNNFFFGLLSSHGAMGSLSLLFLTQPFRKFVGDLISRLLPKKCSKQATGHFVLPISSTHHALNAELK